MDRNWSFSFEEYENQDTKNNIGVHTDHEMLFNEIMKHPTVTEDGEEGYDFYAGLFEYLPQKAGEYGIKQAYVETYFGLRSKGYSASKCIHLLRLDEKVIEELKESRSIIRFRIFPGSTMNSVKETAAEFFALGYEKGLKAISSLLCDAELASAAQKKGNTMAYEMIKKILTKEGYAEYCKLYGKSET